MTSPFYSKGRLCLNTEYMLLGQFYFFYKRFFGIVYVYFSKKSKENFRFIFLRLGLKSFCLWCFPVLVFFGIVYFDPFSIIYAHGG